MVTDPCRSLATNPTNLRILLQSTTKSDYPSTTSRPSFGLQSVSTCPPVDLLSVDLFDLLSMSLPCRTTSTFDFDFTRSTNLDLRLVVDPPRLRLYPVEPPRPSTSTVSRSTSTFTAKLEVGSALIHAPIYKIINPIKLQ
jgi:hypothetical protein